MSYYLGICLNQEDLTNACILIPASVIASMRGKMLLDITSLDFVFLSYDEPNADELYADLLNKVPWAKRVHGISGFDAAHRACADASQTDLFITVDGDNKIHDSFLDVKIEIEDHMLDHAWSWNSRNGINGLIYGNGGLKLWSKAFVYTMESHENDKHGKKSVDFCWDDKYHELPGCFSTSMINGSEFQAFRSGFREGVKMSLDRGSRIPVEQFHQRIWQQNIDKLLIWCSVGRDVENGIWAIHGARLGTYMCNFMDWDHTLISNYDWFRQLWDEAKSIDPIEESIRLGSQLRKKLGLRLTDLSAEQSRFFKAVYVNPSIRLYQQGFYDQVCADDVRCLLHKL